MNPQSTVTITQVITQVVTQAAEMAAIVVPIVFGVNEALKKIPKFPPWVAGLFSPIIGVFILFLVNGFHFTPVGILVGVLAGFATPGIYSTIKSATASAPLLPIVGSVRSGEAGTSMN